MIDIKKAFIISILMHLALVAAFASMHSKLSLPSGSSDKFLLVKLLSDGVTKEPKKLISHAKEGLAPEKRLDNGRELVKKETTAPQNEQSTSKEKIYTTIETDDTQSSVTVSQTNNSVINRDLPASSNINPPVTGIYEVDESNHINTTSTSRDNSTSDLLPLIMSRIESAKEYPKRARKRGLEGTTTVRFRITSDGSVGEVKIVESSGFSILDKASLKTIMRAAPFPYVDSWIKIPISFRLI